MLQLEELPRKTRRPSVEFRSRGSSYRITERDATAIEKALKELLLLLKRAMLHRNSKPHGFADSGDVVLRLAGLLAASNAPAIQLLSQCDQGIVGSVFDRVMREVGSH